MSAQNTSLKKLIQKNSIQKSKTNKLLLTDFNKFSLLNNNLKSKQKKFHLNNKTYTNNSFKNPNYPKNINNSNNKKKYIIQNNNNYINNNELKSTKNCENNTKNENKQINYNNNFLSNNLGNYSKFNKKNNFKSLNCNSVNNLIGINISVNYMNKNYSLNKMKPNFYLSNNNSSKNIQNGKNLNINDNFYNKFISESFNEINKGNISFLNSSGNNKINKKKKFIKNPLQNEFQNFLDNLKFKEIKSTKNQNDNNLNRKKNSINSINEKNNIILSNKMDKISFNNQKNIMEVGKSLSCKNMNMNYYTDEKIKKNICKILVQSLEEKINDLKNNNNDLDEGRLYDIIYEFFIKFCNIIEYQSQKELIINIFYLMNNIINKKEKEILLIQKEKENLIQKNIFYEKNINELIEENNSLINKCNILQNKINELNLEGNIANIYKNKKKENSDNEQDSPPVSNSSYVNTEELESIRFFDKIKMKKNSFSNIPELSFQKIKIDTNKNENIPVKKNEGNKFSFQEKTKYMKKINDIKCNKKEITKHIKSSSNIQKKYKKNINISNKKKSNSSINKGNINCINNNKTNNIGYLFVPDFKKNIIQNKRK